VARHRPLVLAVAAAQVVVPVVLLGARWVQEGSRPTSELGASWQMYTSAPVPRYTGTDAGGRSRSLAAESLPPVLRAVSTGRVVPERLCARYPDVVVVRRVGGPDPGDFRC
jgi:hypothetical protein